MNIAVGSWLWGLPLVVLLAAVFAVGGVLHRRRLHTVFSPIVYERVLPTSVRIRRTLRDVSAFLGLALAVVALAEPRFDKQIRTIETSGTDIVLLLDLSRSMDARDVDPSRIERARREVQDLGRLAAGDRVGLVVFAGGAYPRLPLTEDYRALQLVVEEMNTESFQSQGSDLAGAIRAGLDLLTRSQSQAGQAMVVLSDGETHDATAAREAAAASVDAGIPVYGMGIGIEPSSIPLRDGTRLLHEGKAVITTPDFTVLEEVARITGGGFVRSNASDRDMRSLYDDLRSNVRAVKRETQQRETWRSAFQWPLSVAALLLLGAAWLGDGRRLFGAAAAALLVLGVMRPAEAFADPVVEADELYRAGEFEQAVERLTELSLERPDDAEIFDRLGAARYRAEDWEGAARAYDNAARLRGEHADALFNSGNAHYRAGRLEEAAERFQRAVDVEPDHPAAARNREVVLQEIEARRQYQPPPPPPPQQGGEGEDDSESDEQQQDQPQPQPRGEGDEQDASQEPQEPSEEDGSPSGSPSEADPDEEGSNQQVSPQELDEGDGSEGDPTEVPAGSEMGEDQGPITEGQAHRLLDAIDEGNRPITIRGRNGDKPW
ncbi:MAG: VWA domain-containing protein [Myxococcales bacterium]|nr:VWA domain-containing protein [Myxococcales bacterium]